MPVRGLLEATQRGYIVNILLAVQSVSIISLALLLAYRGWGISGQFLAVFVGMAMFSAGLWSRRSFVSGLGRQLRRKVATPQRRPRRGHPSASDPTRELWSLNWPTLLTNLSGRVSYLTDNIAIAYILGPAAVVPFSLPRRRPSSHKDRSSRSATRRGRRWPSCITPGKRTCLADDFIELTRLVMILGLTLLVPIFAFNRRFVELWIGPDHYAGEAVSMLAVGNALLLSLFSMWGWLFGGTGQVRRVVPLSLAATSINIVVSVVATSKWGLVGPLLGTTAAVMLVHSWCLPMLLRRHFGIPLAALARAALMPLLLGTPCAVAVRSVALLRPRYGWHELMASIAGCGAVYFGLSVWLLLAPTSDRCALERLRRAVRRRHDDGAGHADRPQQSSAPPLRCSVLIPSAGRPEQLGRCLRSLAARTRHRPTRSS